MKKLLPLILLLSLTGCNASEDKTISELELEIAQKKAALEAAKKNGNYPNVSLPAVCIRGVVYYLIVAPHTRHYVPAISDVTLMPERCSEVK